MEIFLDIYFIFNCEGLDVGTRLGDDDGLDGDIVGFFVGRSVGCWLGGLVGDADGGAVVGCSDG